jgi:hypothetical protein
LFAVPAAGMLAGALSAPKLLERSSSQSTTSTRLASVEKRMLQIERTLGSGPAHKRACDEGPAHITATIDRLNTEYEKLHKDFEDNFWCESLTAPRSFHNTLTISPAHAGRQRWPSLRRPAPR